MPTPRQFTSEQVIEFRGRVGRREISATKLSLECGVNRSALSQMLRGVTYADIPGALTEIIPIRENGRMFLPEVVLFMRLNAQAGVSVQALADAHGCSRSAIEFAIKGRHYTEVPEATDISNRRRKLSPEQVDYVRRMYRTRQIPMTALAVEFGMRRTPMNDVIRGNSYKDMPKAVPPHIKAARGKFC